MSDNSDLPKHPAPEVTPPSGEDDFAQRLRETRSRAVIASESVPKRVHRLRKRFETPLQFAALTIIAVLSFLLSNEILRKTTVVEGRIVDLTHQPLAGVRVFVASRPSLAATTDAEGRFRLSHVPLGRQSIVAALEEAGAEYPVTAKRSAVNDLGELVYDVPPESVRRSPGSGADWGTKAPQPWPEHAIFK